MIEFWTYKKEYSKLTGKVFKKIDKTLSKGL